MRYYINQSNIIPNIIVPIAIVNEYSRILYQIKGILSVFHSITIHAKKKMKPARNHGNRKGLNPRHAPKIDIPNVAIPPQNAHIAPNHIIKSDMNT